MCHIKMYYLHTARVLKLTFLDSITVYLFLKVWNVELALSTLQIKHFNINLIQGRLLTQNNIYVFAYTKNNLKG